MTIDLTHVLHSNMPVYPGTEKPIFITETSFEKDGFLEKKISFLSHTGTHMDAPAHIFKDAKTLDDFSVEHFMGEALCLDVEGEFIEEEFLRAFEDDFKKVDFVIFRSGWSKFWGSEKYFENFPTLTCKGAKFLCKFNLKGIGLDMISIDKIENESFSIHKIILQQNILIIENLTNLEKVPNRFKFYAFPLHIMNADGAPIRAIAKL